eukprot:10814820-Ditylum_brightwellii.AAC.1
MLDANVEVIRKPFKDILGVESVVCIQRHLVSMEQERACVASYDGAATEFGRLGLFPSFMRKTTPML